MRKKRIAAFLMALVMVLQLVGTVNITTAKADTSFKLDATTIKVNDGESPIDTVSVSYSGAGTPTGAISCTMQINSASKNYADNTEIAAYKLVDAVTSYVSDNYGDYYFELPKSAGAASAEVYAELCKYVGDNMSKICEDRNLTAPTESLYKYSVKIAKNITLGSNSDGKSLSLALKADSTALKEGDNEVGSFSISDDGTYYNVTFERNNNTFWAIPGNLGFSVGVSITGDVNKVASLTSKNENGVISFSADFDEDVSEPEEGDYTYTIKKDGVNLSSDDFDLNPSYKITIGSEAKSSDGQTRTDGRALAGVTVYDYGPNAAGDAASTEYKLSKAVLKMDGNETDITNNVTGGYFSYTFPDKTTATSAAIELEYKMTDSKAKAYVSGSSVSKQVENAAHLKYNYEDSSKTDDITSNKVTYGAGQSRQYMKKTGSQNSSNPQMMDWTLGVNTKYTHASGVYLIDYLSAGNQEYSSDGIKVYNAATGSTATLKFTNYGNPINLSTKKISSFENINKSNIATVLGEVSTPCIVSLTTNGITQYGFIYNLDDIYSNMSNDLTKGGNCRVTYQTLLTSAGDYSDQISKGDSVTAENSARLVATHMCTGTQPGEDYFDFDGSIDKDSQTVTYNVFTKTAGSYSAATHTQPWTFDINKYGATYDSVIIKDTMVLADEATGKPAKGDESLSSVYVLPEAMQKHETITFEAKSRSGGANGTSKTLSYKGNSITLPDAGAEKGLDEGYYIVKNADSSNNTYDIYFVINNIDPSYHYTYTMNTKVVSCVVLGQNGQSVNISNSAASQVKNSGKWGAMAESKGTKASASNKLLSKSSLGYDASKNTIKWKITTNDYNTAFDEGYKLVDTLPEGVTFVRIDSITRTGEDEKSASLTLPDNGDITWSVEEGTSSSGYSSDTLTFDIKDDSQNNKYDIVYTTYIDEDYRADKLGNGQSVSFVNQVKYDDCKYDGLAVNADAKASAPVKYDRVVKNADKTSLPSDGVITWTINFNRDAISMKGKTLSDDLKQLGMADYLEFDMESVEIYRGTVAEDASTGFAKGDKLDNKDFSVNISPSVMTIDIPEKYDKTPLVITVKTTVTNAPNGAVLQNTVSLTGGDNKGTGDYKSGSNKVSTSSFNYDSYAQSLSLPRIALRKYDSDEKTMLSGAKFEASYTSSSGKTVTKSLTSSDKKAKYFINMPTDKVIKVSETEAPAGYRKMDTAYYIVFLDKKGKTDYRSDLNYSKIIFVTMSEDSTIYKLDVKNYKDNEVTDININMNFSDKDAGADDERLVDTEYSIYEYTEVGVSDTAIKTTTPSYDSSTGKAVITFDKSLLQNGKSYVIRQTRRSKGYAPSKDIKVDIKDYVTTYSYLDSDEKFDMTAIDTPISDICLIKRFDLEGTGLDSADVLSRRISFTLYADEDCKEAVGDPVSPSLDDSSKEYVVRFDSKDYDLSTDTTYYLKETATDSDWILSDEVFACKVDSDGQVTYKKLSDDDAEYTEAFPVCVNAPVSLGVVRVIKTYTSTELKGISDEEKSYLEDNTVFTLTLITEDDTDTDDTETATEWTAHPSIDTENGVAVVRFTQDENGDDIVRINSAYKLEETSSPSGYTADDSVTYVKVDHTGAVTYSDAKDGVYTDSVPVYTNKREAVSARLIKTYEGLDDASLSEAEKDSIYGGTEFTLYRDDVVYGKASPASYDGKAVVTFENVVVGATYTMKETKAPSGYDLSSNTYVCRVLYDGTVEYKLYGDLDEAFSEEFPVCVNSKTKADVDADDKKSDEETVTTENEGTTQAPGTEGATDEPATADKKDDTKTTEQNGKTPGTGDSAAPFAFMLLFAVSAAGVYLVNKKRG